MWLFGYGACAHARLRAATSLSVAMPGMDERPASCLPARAGHARVWCSLTAAGARLLSAVHRPWPPPSPQNKHTQRSSADGPPPCHGVVVRRRSAASSPTMTATSRQGRAGGRGGAPLARRVLRSGLLWDGDAGLLRACMGPRGRGPTRGVRHGKQSCSRQGMSGVHLAPPLPAPCLLLNTLGQGRALALEPVLKFKCPPLFPLLCCVAHHHHHHHLHRHHHLPGPPPRLCRCSPTRS